MKSFFLSIIKQVFAFIIALFLIGCILIALTRGLIYFMQKPVIHIDKNSVLVIDIATIITDSSQEKELRESFADWVQGEYIPKAYLLEVIEAIEKATHDSRIIGIYLKSNTASDQQESGYPILHEVRKAIEAFKKSGKPVLSYFINADVKDYFLGSIANKIVMSPLGHLSLKGLAFEMLYFGDAFQKYGIGVQFTKVGKYKSAIDPFIRNNMSPADKEQLEALLHDLWDNIVKMLADSRGLETNFIKKLSETEGLFLSSAAIEHKLIDDIQDQNEAFNYFKSTLNQEESSKKITLKQYIREVEQNKLLNKALKSKPQIAVLYAEGEIVDGEGHSYEVGADRIEGKIDKIHDDQTIKAVVLRVNSVGGEVHASDKILRAIRKLQLKKPVVVSFGSVAASGGYWIACYGNAIFTDPMTLTGSIGIFGLLFNVQDIANNHGINFDRVITGPFAGMDSYGQPKTAAEMAKLQDNTDLMYNTFLFKVAEGRKMDLNKVESIAEGRIWSGLKAKEIGLADFYGGLKDAINYAATIANLGDNWELKSYPSKTGFAHSAIEFFQESSDAQEISSSLISKYLKHWKQSIKSLNSFNKPSGIYARMPTTLILN